VNNPLVFVQKGATGGVVIREGGDETYFQVHQGSNAKTSITPSLL